MSSTERPDEHAEGTTAWPDSAASLSDQPAGRARWSGDGTTRARTDERD